MRLIDASVAVKFALDEDDHLSARMLIEDALCAPELILAETANGWWKALARGALTGDQFHSAVGSLPGAFETLYPTEPVLQRAARLADEMQHPVYDCVYLAWAEQTGIPLLTADRRLMGKASAAGRAGLCVALVP